MTFENCTIDQFKRAKFNKDFSEITKDELDDIYLQYIDTAKMYNSSKFNKISYINFLRKRIFVISTAINLHKNYLEDVGIAYEEGFGLFKKYGYTLVWKYPEDFISQLDKISKKENKYMSLLKKEEIELNEMDRDNIKEDEVLSRQSFIRTILLLGKNGYKIDNFTTTMEELSLTILQEKEYFKSN